MDKRELPFLTVAELGRLIESREVSPVEATEAYLARTEELNPKLSAYITVCGDEALAAARTAEEQVQQGNYLGPMHGIPFAVKDQMWSAGVRTTNSSKVLAEDVPEEDATVVARLKGAGGVLLGKLNMMEFASGGRFEYPFGMAKNPWNVAHETGGSSSGSGAATAASLCATSLGEDTFGSIRVPSSWSGVVGLRPTWGRVSRYGVYGLIWSMDTAGPMSRTVEDCAITLTPLCGYDPKDPYTQRAETPDFREALTGNVKGLKVGVLRELTFENLVAPVVREAALKAVTVLEELGAEAEEVSLPMTSHARPMAYILLYAERSARYHQWSRERLSLFDHDLQVGLRVGDLIPAAYYYKAQRLRAILREQVLEALSRYDVLVSPTMRVPADRIEPFRMAESKEEEMDRVAALPDQTPTVPLTGATALSVPCGFTSGEPGGLPIGFQIIGRPFAEATILNAAYAYEQATPWHTRRPEA